MDNVIFLLGFAFEIGVDRLANRGRSVWAADLARAEVAGDDQGLYLGISCA